MRPLLYDHAPRPGAAKRGVLGAGSSLDLRRSQGRARSLYARRVALEEARTVCADMLEPTHASDGTARDLDALEARLLLVRLARGDSDAPDTLRALHPKLLTHGFEDLPREIEDALVAANAGER